MPNISLIIVNFNGRSFLGELFQSVAQQTRPADEVFLVDNASTDNSLEFVREFFPWVKVIPLKANVGFAEGNNIGLARAKGDYIALLNSDTVIEKNLLAEMCKALDSDSCLGAVVPKIYGKSDIPKIQGVGAEFNNLGNFWGRGCNQYDHGQYDVVTEVGGVTACATLIRRKALHGEALFDKDFFMYNEEFELSLRLLSRGFRIQYIPRAIVFHKESQSVKQIAPNQRVFSQFFGNRNRGKILTKFYPLSVLLRSFPVIFLSFIYWNWFFLRQGGWRLFFQAVTSQIHFAFKGAMERWNGNSVDPQGWLPWMKYHRLKEVLALKRMLME